MLKRKVESHVDYEEVNDTIHLTKKILKIAYILTLILAVYIITMLIKEWHLKEMVLTILKTISPLFFGLFFAWLFYPIIYFLEKKGMRRGAACFITYIVVLLIVVLLLSSIFPVLSDQINDFVKMVPTVFDNIKTWITEVLEKFQNTPNFDVETVRTTIFKKIEEVGTGLTDTLPEKIFGGVKSALSGIGTVGLGAIIGFYLSISFKSPMDTIVTFLPHNWQDDARDLLNEVNTTCRHFVKGALLDSSLIFVVSSLAFFACGLRAPLLFGLFCGITNVIPYAGPYIGGAPAVIVAFSQNPTTGIFVLIAIVVIQAIEGNFLQALIMSKTTKLHPVSIILGLLVFGYFFGIIGMVLSTPIIGACKAIFVFFNTKYHFLEKENA